MRSLKTHIAEGLLQGMDSTLDYGDKVIKKAEKEFIEIRKYTVSDMMLLRWSHTRTSMGSDVYWITFDAENICTVLGLDGNKYLTIHCVNAPYTKQKDFTVGFYFHETKENKYSREFYPIDLDDTSNIEMVLKSIFKKFKTFNDFINYTKSIL